MRRIPVLVFLLILMFQPLFLSAEKVQKTVSSAEALQQQDEKGY